jgi:predicted N-acetyltransferase YhbS
VQAQGVGPQRTAIAFFEAKKTTELLTGHPGREAAIVDLFTVTFTESEGEEEGALIGALARNLLGGTAAQDLFVFSAQEAGRIIGSVICSRLTFEEDARTVFVLAPVAVAPDLHCKGVGQRLLSHALAALRSAGVDIAMTYGDPSYYAKVGFTRISEADAPAPFAFSQPEGWLAQSLKERPMTPLRGPSRCVDPVFR